LRNVEVYEGLEIEHRTSLDDIIIIPPSVNVIDVWAVRNPILQVTTVELRKVLEKIGNEAYD
jgi:hypothetical protein